MKSWLAAVAMLGTAACSGDFTELPDATATGGADSTGGPTTRDTDDLPGAGTEAGPGEDDDSSGELDEAGCDIDCGDGYCDLDGQGSPVCVCDDGFAAFGLRCLPCIPTDGDISVDIPSVAVIATFTLNGEPFTSSVYEHGDILLRDPQSNDEITLGSTRDGGSPGAIAVVPGTYEIHFAGRTGGQLVPANRSALIETIEIPASQDFELSVDIPAVTLTGDLLLGGSTPPDSIYDNGAIVLRNSTTGDEVELGDMREGEYRAMVVPGVYDLHYRGRATEGIAPLNRNARFGVVEVSADDSALSIDIDIPVTSMQGAIELDGATPPDSIYENGQLLLRDLQTDDEVVLANTRDGAYTQPVLPGRYALVYRRLVGGTVVPANQGAVLSEIELGAGEQLYDVDIQTALVTGSITVAGAPPPQDPSDDGRLLLRNPVTHDEAVLGNTRDGAYTQRVVRGSYDVYYRQQASSGGVPANTNARLQSIDIQGGATFDIDIPMVTVSASITLNGQEPPVSAYDDGLLYLRETATGDSVLLGNTRLADLQRPVIPGTYELVYVVEAAGPTVPINADARLGSVDAEGGAALLVDIPSLGFGGPITVGGQEPPASVYDRGVLLLHDVASEDLIYLGPIDQGSVTRAVTGGTYVVTYRALSSNGLVPANTNVGLGCFELLP